MSNNKKELTIDLTEIRDKLKIRYQKETGAKRVNITRVDCWKYIAWLEMVVMKTV